ncbi:MAG TPA: hypothetical protein VFN10_21830 [Thermoanaerobaculia bacterium]|nr:hypothetical protein [Thermoanaerobaculia bacterium]
MTNPQPLLRSLVYSSDPQPFYPEINDPRFGPASHPIGVCFSGGGPRSLVASTGQMSGLLNAPKGLYDLIGAISCVSGGSWFGSLFSFGDPSIPDSVFLGPPIDPAKLTTASIRGVAHNYLPFGVTTMTNAAITGSLLYSATHHTPSNRLYARMLNALLVNPFNVSDLDRFFALDPDSIATLLQNNPGLTANDFYFMRPRRPYLVCGATQIYPVDHDLEMRHFEYSPLYDGTPHFFPSGTPTGPFGGGYMENFAFDSSNPQTPDAQGLITVDAPLHRFTISDMMGSSGAAPGSVLDSLGFPSLFAEFHYWPPRSAGAVPDPTTQKMSIVDGGDLENTGIVAMLQRRYPVIVACINTSTPMNPNWDRNNPSDHAAGTYEGIDFQVAGLFGHQTPETTATREVRRPTRRMTGMDIPAKMMAVAPGDEMPESLKISVPQQPIQVFPAEDWPAVQQGLMNALATGGPVWCATKHRIWPDNPFAIEPYPNDGTVTVIWLYNQKIAQWISKLPPDTQKFLTSTNERNYMANFPNYHTVLQNKDFFHIPELLLLTPQQVNLLAQMWSWAVLEIADDIRKIAENV